MLSWHPGPPPPLPPPQRQLSRCCPVTRPVPGWQDSASWQRPSTPPCLRPQGEMPWRKLPGRIPSGWGRWPPGWQPCWTLCPPPIFSWAAPKTSECTPSAPWPPTCVKLSTYWLKSTVWGPPPLAQSPGGLWWSTPAPSLGQPGENFLRRAEGPFPSPLLTLRLTWIPGLPSRSLRSPQNPPQQIRSSDSQETATSSGWTTIMHLYFSMIRYGQVQPSGTLRRPNRTVE